MWPKNVEWPWRWFHERHRIRGKQGGAHYPCLLWDTDPGYLWEHDDHKADLWSLDDLEPPEALLAMLGRPYQLAGGEVLVWCDERAVYVQNPLSSPAGGWKVRVYDREFRRLVLSWKDGQTPACVLEDWLLEHVREEDGWLLRALSEGEK